MSASAIRATFAVGDEYDVTNHYITREDHACFGTKRRTVTKVTSGGLWLSHPLYPEGSRVPWPRASELVANDDGTVQFFGHPKPGALFLTFTRVPDEKVCETCIGFGVCGDCRTGQTRPTPSTR